MEGPIENTIPTASTKLTKEDFASDQMVKWCPGCGSFFILNAVEKVFPEIGYKPENFVIVSGIGCSSRFPYYVNTYGFHGIHGRAHAIATGVKLANPDLSVWITTGDGDSMAIGGNHFIHIVRRNIDVNILLFNNQIYGLTKGQYSPTSPIGTLTKTSPYGTIENPFNAGNLVLGAQGSFFARTVDNNVPLMTKIMFEAAKHDGTSVVEIMQNCIVFNDKAHEEVTNRLTKEDNQLIVEHGKPMIFGKEKDKGMVFDGTKLKIVKIGENGVTLNDILIHDAYSKDPAIHRMLLRMMPPEYPMVLGVIRSVAAETYDDLMVEQINVCKEKSDIKCVDDLLNSGDTWEV